MSDKSFIVWCQNLYYSYKFNNVFISTVWVYDTRIYLFDTLSCLDYLEKVMDILSQNTRLILDENVLDDKDNYTVSTLLSWQ